MSADVQIVVQAEGISRYQADMNRATQATQGATSKMSGMMQNLGGVIASTFGAAAIGAFVKKALESSVAFETLSTQFEVFTGSAANARKTLNDLAKFEAATPFNTDQVNSAGRSLIAFGFTAEKLIPTMKMVGDVSAAVGKDYNELAVIYGKARTAGTLYAEDINQLTEAGIPIIEELSKVMGVQSDQVKKLGSEGKIHFSELEKAFQNMTGEGGRFNGMMDKMSQTTGGLISSIESKLLIELRHFGDALKPILDDVVKGFNPAFATFKSLIISMVEPFRSIGSALGELGKALGFSYTEGSAFATIMKVLSVTTKIAMLPITLLSKLITKVIEGFTWAASGVSGFIGKFPLLQRAIEVLTAPLRALVDGLSWVGEKLGLIEKEGSANMGMWNSMKAGLVGIAKEAGASGAQMSAFVKQLDLSHYAGLSTTDQIKLLKIELFNFLHPGDAAAKAMDTMATSATGAGKAVKDLADSFGYIGMAEPYLLKAAMDAADAEKQRQAALRESAKEIADLADVMKMSGESGEDPIVKAMNERVKSLVVSTDKMKAIFKDLKDQVKGYMAGMAADVAFSIGEAIGSGGSIADVVKQTLRELAVQVPRMTGMALLNAAQNPLNSTIALPLAAAGLALIGASGLISGLFKAADKRKESLKVASNAGASTGGTTAAAPSGLAQFVNQQSGISDAIRDGLQGVTLYTQTSSGSFEMVVNKAVKNGRIAQGR